MPGGQVQQDTYPSACGRRIRCFNVRLMSHNMNDVDGHKVNIGDVVRVLVVRDNIPLTDDEKPYIQQMLNNDYEVDNIVNHLTQVSVSYTVKTNEGCMWGGLYLFPNEFKLIEKKSNRASIVVDWQEIIDIEGFYSHILKQIEAPKWHGRNLDALQDSLVTGGISLIGPPFNYYVSSEDYVKHELKELSNVVKSIFKESVQLFGGELNEI